MNLKFAIETPDDDYFNHTNKEHAKNKLRYTNVNVSILFGKAAQSLNTLTEENTRPVGKDLSALSPCTPLPGSGLASLYTSSETHSIAHQNPSINTATLQKARAFPTTSLH